MKHKTILIILIIIAANSTSMATVYLEDGLSHVFDASNHLNEWLLLDYYTANTPGTHIDLVTGGLINGGLNAYKTSSVTMSDGAITSSFNLSDNSVGTISGGSVGTDVWVEDNADITITDGTFGGWFLAKDYATVIMSDGAFTDDLMAEGHSTVTINGGSFGGYFGAYNYASLTMNGGTVMGSFTTQYNPTVIISGGSVAGYLRIDDDTNATMSGGSIGGYLRATDNGNITVSGGSIGGLLWAEYDAIISLTGMDFEVNGVPLKDGDKLSNFGTLIENDIKDYYTGTITGVLADGSALNNAFEIYKTAFYSGTADIIVDVVPVAMLPVADAGANQTVTDEDDNGTEQINLDGSGSSDGNGNVVSWEWSDDIGDVIPDGEITTASLSVGTHIIKLTVTNDAGYMDTDTVTVTIHPIDRVLTIKVEPEYLNIDSIDPSKGEHAYYKGTIIDLNATRYVECPNVRHFDHWVGDVVDPSSAQTTVLMDSDKTVTAVFVDGAICGDECHPNFTLGDLNHDCIVDMADIAIIASRWLNCFAPECD